MGNVVRIPTQHRSLPHCPSCDRRLPNFRILGGGRDLSWPDVDEDLHVVDLLYPPSYTREFK